jgi:hypothetical protein
MYRILGFFVPVMRIMNQETLKGETLNVVFGRFGRNSQFLSNSEIGLPFGRKNITTKAEHF